MLSKESKREHKEGLIWPKNIWKNSPGEINDGDLTNPRPHEVGKIHILKNWKAPLTATVLMCTHPRHVTVHACMRRFLPRDHLPFTMFE